jgi:hypothetical protein
MLKLFILLLFFLPLKVDAEYFFPYGNIEDNRFYDTLGFAIGNIPESNNCPNCIEYMNEDVRGDRTDVVTVNIFNSVVTSTGYGLKRIAGVYDSVSLPPFSSVDFVYWYSNNSSKSVNIYSLYIFLSRGISSYGDLTKVLDIDGEYINFNLLYRAWNYPRIGIARMYSGLGIVSAHSSNSFKIDSVYIQSPLIFSRWEASLEQDYVLIRVYVKNISSIALSDISYQHYEYISKRDYLPNEEHMYEYVLKIDGNNSLGYASIYNPNTYKECAVLGENENSNIVGDSAIVTGVREENGNYLNYVGSRVKPLVESFCITRIPYKVYSSEIVLESVQEDQEVVLGMSVEDINIKKLPQTSKSEIFTYLPLFLVVVLLLWYYLKRRF